jgi:methylmalonyl-CoA mutase N-terminal domain/subunit
MDEALGLPTETSARIALRTQQIIAHETGVGATVDPVAGSYAIEKLTDDLEHEAFELIGKIDAMGGMLAAIDAGWVQKQIHDAAYRFQREVEQDERIVVGVNAYETGNEGGRGEILRLDDSAENAQLAKLVQLRKTRDADQVDDALAALAAAATTDANVVPFILETVRAYATVGEICGVLRQVWGEYTPKDSL